MWHKAIVLLFPVVQTRVSFRVLRRARGASPGGASRATLPRTSGKRLRAVALPRRGAGAAYLYEKRPRFPRRWWHWHAAGWHLFLPAATCCAVAAAAPASFSLPRCSARPRQQRAQGAAGRGLPPHAPRPQVSPSRCPRVCAAGGSVASTTLEPHPGPKSVPASCAVPGGSASPHQQSPSLPASRLHVVFCPVFLCDVSLRVLCPF